MSVRGRRQMDQVLETAAMLLFVIDPAGTVTFLEAPRRVLGVDPVLSVGKPAQECFQDAPEILERLRAALAGEPFSGVLEVAQTGGFIDLTCRPIRSPDGAVTGVSGVMLDATERMRSDEARRRAEAKSLLIATMNHEARTPLNAILGFTELLGSGRHGELNEGQRRFVANIDSAGRQLLALVSDAIDLTQLETGAMILSPTNLRAAAILDAAIEPLEPVAAAREVRLTASCPPDLTVHADRTRLLQVLSSLAANAVRFTPHGGTVSLAARALGRFTQIDVADTGPGIPADRLSRIYLEFTANGPPGEASGLGLSLTRQLVALMGGRVTVSSRLGTGTTFSLRLPGSMYESVYARSRVSAGRAQPNWRIAFYAQPPMVLSLAVVGLEGWSGRRPVRMEGTSMPDESNARSGITRRDALKLGVAAGAAASVAAVVGTTAEAAAPTDLNEATIAQLQSAMQSGRLTSSHLVDFYLSRIRSLDQGGPGVNSVLELNPEARAIAHVLDAERRKKGSRGPLHGIPVLLKDNIDTGDRMQTAAGSLALVGRPALRDSTLVKNLRAAGAVILGKTNLSEWANFRSTSSSSGWSGRGGQCNNPYFIDFNPCGSSSGSAAAVSANFTAVGIGTETDGSIVCPANVSGVVGLKPTIGLVSRAGVVPISHTQDSPGPHGRTVADVAAVLGAIQSKTSDGRDAATGDVPLGWSGTGRTRPTNIPSDYTQFLNGDGLRGARLGLWAAGSANASPKEAAAFSAAQDAMKGAGATLVTFDFLHAGDINSGNAEFLILLYDFKLDLPTYLADRTGVPIHTLADAISFNTAHAAAEMPWFGQEIFELAQAMDTSGPDQPQPLFGGMTYNQALAMDRLIGGTEGIDKVLHDNNLDAIVAATANISWATDLVNGDRPNFFGASTPPAIVGYPIISVPMALVKGLPLGISFFGTAFSEPTLIRLASGFERVTKARRVPKFIQEIGLNPHSDPGDQGDDGGNHKGGPDRPQRPAMI